MRPVLGVQHVLPRFHQLLILDSLPPYSHGYVAHYGIVEHGGTWKSKQKHHKSSKSSATKIYQSLELSNTPKFQRMVPQNAQVFRVTLVSSQSHHASRHPEDA